MDAFPNLKTKKLQVSAQTESSLPFHLVGIYIWGTDSNFRLIDSKVILKNKTGKIIGQENLTILSQGTSYTSQDGIYQQVAVARYSYFDYPEYRHYGGWAGLDVLTDTKKEPIIGVYFQQVNQNQVIPPYNTYRASKIQWLPVCGDLETVNAEANISVIPNMTYYKSFALYLFIQSTAYPFFYC